jgi:hypothetical protein
MSGGDFQLHGTGALAILIFFKSQLYEFQENQKQIML